MIKTGPRNAITDVAGLTVGNAHVEDYLTGTTVLLTDQPYVCGADIRGGGPATRETELLKPENMVQGVDALFLSGGSAFGLAAGDGVAAELSRTGAGFAVGSWQVPIVPGAALFDLRRADMGWGEDFPYHDLGRQAVKNAGPDFQLGNAGAGMGAMAGSLKGGLGTASQMGEDGLMVAALVAVNPVGSVVMPASDAFWAWPFEVAGEFGGRRPDTSLDIREEDGLEHARRLLNTTIGIIATNAKLTKAECCRIATMAHDGYARAIRPVHTPLDGDSIFAMATGEQDRAVTPLDISRIGMMAADCMTRAIARGVFAADSIGGNISYREKFGVSA